MPYEFLLSISGLCALVPFAGGMRVVLINARHYLDDDSPVNPGTLNSEIHVPLLVARQENTGKSPRRPSFTFTNRLLDSGPLDAFALDGEDLTILQVKGSGVEAPGPVPYCPANASDNTKFGWVAKMDDLSAGRVTKDTSPTANPVGVIARVSFPAAVCANGGFALDNFHTHPRGQVVKWTYADHANHADELSAYQPRALAETIDAKILINDQFLVAFGGGKQGDIILDRGGAATLESVFLFNVTYPALFKEKVKEPRTPDHHFRHYYRLTDAVDRRFVPKPLPAQVCTEFFGGLGGPRCPPAYFEG